ncbi:MAG: hypothetical protein Aurels2KO_03580 [Aureliella sp.]
MKEYGNFDVSSTPGSPKPANASELASGASEESNTTDSGNSSAGQSGNSGARRRKTIRVIFECCNVYGVVPIPPRVLSGELSSWRFHCPRCGRATEVPV